MKTEKPEKEIAFEKLKKIIDSCTDTIHILPVRNLLRSYMKMYKTIYDDKDMCDLRGRMYVKQDELINKK